MLGSRRPTSNNPARQEQGRPQDAAIAQPSAALAWIPLAGICCIALAAFSIAAVIVLALIPLYLPTKGSNSNQAASTNTYVPTTFSAVYPMRWINGAPDGVPRRLLTINDQFPGPTIIVRRGDIINITLINQFDEPTTMHWHGMLQRETTHMDGVPGVSQCQILPGQSFTYTFSTSAQTAGTYWYHSHEGVQLGDGLQGALIVQDPDEPWRSSYTDEDLFLLAEWSHTEFHVLLDIFLEAPQLEAVPDLGLINGIGQFNCTPNVNCTYYRTFIQPGVTKRFRFINTSLYSKITVSIDQHTMRVIEADGIPLDGTKYVKTLRFNPAQRYSVLVTGKTNPAPSYWIRATLHDYATDIGLYTSALSPNQSAILQYTTNNNFNVSIIVPALDTFNNDALAIRQSFISGEVYADETGMYPHPNGSNQVFPNSDAVRTFVYDITQIQGPDGPTGQIRFAFNNYTFVHPAHQTMLGALLLNNQTALNTPLTINIESGDVIDLVINNIDALPHPMHLHGHEKWLVAAGQYNGGYYNSTTAPTIPINTINPIVRDVITLNVFTYIILRFVANNPGIWIIHCHNDYHLNLGMALVVVESPEQLRNYYLNRTSTINIPTTCDAH